MFIQVVELRLVRSLFDNFLQWVDIVSYAETLTAMQVTSMSCTQAADFVAEGPGGIHPRLQ